MEQLTKIYDCILDGDMDGTSAAVQAAIDADIPAGQIMNEGMIAAMAEVGRLFEEGEYFVPEMLIAARAMKAGLALIQPLLVEFGDRAGRQGRGRHCQRRSARYRQESGRHDAGGRRV